MMAAPTRRTQRAGARPAHWHLFLTAALTSVGAVLAQESPGTSERATVLQSEVGAQLDDYLTRCAAFGFSGAVLVEHEGELILRKGYGVADPLTGAPNTPETLFDIASASKQVTAAAILKLEADGRLSTSDPVGDYLPGWPEQDADVTIDHLLMHTSGFPRFGPTGGGPTIEGAVQSFTRAGRNAEPGERFDYWNGGYALLAAIVETVAEEPFEDWVRDNLFRPAGVLHSDFIETARVDTERLARTHEDGNKLTTDYISGWGYRGMGGMLTSVSDLAIWVRQVLTSDAVLDAGAREKLITPGLGHYARGWYVLDTDPAGRCVQHGGTSPGFQTYIRYFIDDDTLTLVLCNREGMHWQVAWGLEAILYDTTPKVPEPPEVAALTEEDVASWEGTWDSKDGSRLVISRAGASLQIAAQGSRALAELSGEGGGGSSLEKSRKLAATIVDELVKGEVETLEKSLRPGIPGGWPKVVRTRIWPDHVAEWGAVESVEELGALSGRRGDQIWFGLQHERGDRAVKLVISDGKLSILDLKAGRYPLTRFYAPVSEKRLETYDFSPTEGPVIELEGGKRPKLQLGKTTFEREDR